ncbi:MAG TPA: hypothetical protein VKT77_13480, partial [Chthonomonadaceae bacterium]|nr:hypothetical protein [Chthonomonadaceae bacterium]
MSFGNRAAWFKPALGIVARAAGAVAGTIALLVLSLLALNIPPLPALASIWEGAIGTAETGTIGPLSVTVTKTAPLLLTGLSVAVAWRAGMFSIGAEGQLLMGALAATALWAGMPAAPPALLVIAMLALAAGAGAAWGGIAGWLRVRRGVPEVISTIMLNYIALDLIGALVTAPGRLHGRTQSGPHSDPLPDAVSLPNL